MTESARKKAYRYVAEVLDDGPHRDTGDAELDAALLEIRKAMAAAGAVPPGAGAAAPVQTSGRLGGGAR